MLRLASRVSSRPSLSAFARAIHVRRSTPSFSFVAPKEDKDAADPDARSHEQMLLRLNAAAVRHHDAGELGEAHELFEQLVEGRREHNGDAHPLTIYALGWLTDVRRLRGDLQAATSTAREAVSSARATLGSAHPDTLGMMTNLTSMLKEAGELEEAAQLGREAVGRYSKREPDGCMDTLSAVSVLSQVLLLQGKSVEAEPLLRTDLRLSRWLLGADHPHSLTSAGRLAQCLAERGKHAEAHEVLAEQLGGLPEAQQMLREQLAKRGHVLGER